MKQLLTMLILLGGLFQGFSQGFTVQNYTVDIHIHEDGYFDVVEQYRVDFTQYKHGIYRTIQTNYDLLTSEGKQEKRKIELSNIEVPGHKVDINNKFSRRLEGFAKLKIGDPNRTIIGPQQYTIKYRVKNAFLHEEDATRFYWNIKPTQWFAPFRAIRFRVHLPPGVRVDESDCFTYSGRVGTPDLTDEFVLDLSDGLYSGTSTPNLVSNYGHAVTVLINLPKDSIAELKPAWPFWTNYGWTLIIAFLAVVLYSLWRKYGKDTPVTTTTSYYPPDNMDPAMAGFLIDDQGDTSDLISLIPYWGHRGLIRIEEIDKKGLFAKDDTKIIKLKELPGGEPTYERKMWNGLFKGSSNEVLVSSLKNTFYTTMGAAKIQLKKEAQRYYDKKAKAVRNIVWGVLVLLTIVLIPICLYLWGILATVLVFVSCVVLMILNRFMIKKNRLGDKVFTELKGFREFIKTAEENKLKMLLSESPMYFESTLGYALAFGAFAGWARKFQSMQVDPPHWYHGSTGSFNSMDNFSKSFSNTISATKSTMVSAPSSSGSGGGGSSGGGFGGGGGGSW